MKNKPFKICLTDHQIALATLRSCYSGSLNELTISIDSENSKNVFMQNRTYQHHFEFHDEADAKNFVDEISMKLLRRAGFKRLTRVCKKILIGLFAASLLTFLLNLNASVYTFSNYLTAHASQDDVNNIKPGFVQGDFPHNKVPVKEVAQSNLPSPSQAEDMSNKASPDIVARTLKQGVITGDYSVDLNPDSGPDVYVFSDPSCPHCRAAETVLEELSKEGVNVHIFPVSVITEDFFKNSDPVRYNKVIQGIVSLMCHRDSDRAASWTKLMNITPSLVPQPTPPLISCEAGQIAISRNNEMFHAIGAPGTPAFINSAGQQFPLERNLTVPEVKAWATLK